MNIEYVFVFLSFFIRVSESKRESSTNDRNEFQELRNELLYGIRPRALHARRLSSALS